MSKRLGQRIEWFERVASTNDHAKAHAAELEHGAVVGADFQSAGRGTHGRAWSSDSADDLYFSVVLREQLELKQLPLLALKTALAVVRTLGDIDLRAAIKWPNDVLVNEKKICGILIESSVQGTDLAHVVVGVGLNLGRTEFVGDFELEPTSVALEGRQAPDRKEILAAFLTHFEVTLAQDAESTVAQTGAHLAWRGQNVSLDGNQGKLLGLDARGALRLQTQSGEHTFTAGRLKRL